MRHGNPRGTKLRRLGGGAKTHVQASLIPKLPGSPCKMGERGREGGVKKREVASWLFGGGGVKLPIHKVQ